jgi:AmmeMemoRadiSam system protein B
MQCAFKFRAPVGDIGRKGVADIKTIREPAVAGLFYPDDANALEKMVVGYLQEARCEGVTGDPVVPKALIVPHAGYVYSAPVAATAYARISGDAAKAVRRVVLLGPAHRVAFRGLALPGVDAFRTPLGTVPVDGDAVAEILNLDQVRVSPSAHKAEHSLEVHLPFLQKLLCDFALVPLVVGSASAGEVAKVLEVLWGGEETLIVVSTDLSHYNDYRTAKSLDAATSAAIEALDEERIGFDDACGRTPLSGLLVAARAHGLSARTLDLRNSGDTAGDRRRVVGYGAYMIA